MSFLGVKRPDRPKKQSVTWDSQSISAKTTTPVTCDGRIDWNGTVFVYIRVKFRVGHHMTFMWRFRATSVIQTQIDRSVYRQFTTSAIWYCHRQNGHRSTCNGEWAFKYFTPLGDCCPRAIMYLSMTRPFLFSVAFQFLLYLLTELVQDFIIVLAVVWARLSDWQEATPSLDCDLLSDHWVPRMFVNVDLLSFLRSRRQVGYILVSEITPLCFLRQYHTWGVTYA